MTETNLIPDWLTKTILFSDWLTETKLISDWLTGITLTSRMMRMRASTLESGETATHSR